MHKNIINDISFSIKSTEVIKLKKNEILVANLSEPHHVFKKKSRNLHAKGRKICRQRYKQKKEKKRSKTMVIN